MRLFCKLGLHKWSRVTYSREVCVYCEKEKLIVRAILESDLRAMVENGELSLKAYSKAVEKGYIEADDWDLEDDL